MFEPKWPFLLILIVYGPGVIFVKYLDRLPCDWDMFYTLGRAPVQRKLCPIFMSGVGLPDIHEYSTG